MSDQFPSKETVRRLREQYPEGTRVELVSMDDPYTKLAPGEKGTVTSIDDTGTIFCRWDSGSGLGLVYGVDQFRKIEPEKDSPRYETGAHFWRDTAVSYGMEEALGICGRYLDTQLGHELPQDEHQFCREFFTAMCDDPLRLTDPAKLVYPYDFPKANDRMEASHYHDSRKLNNECAKSIDDAIHKSCYTVNHYNLDIAAMKVVQDYGFERVNMVLAKNIKQRDYDGRVSSVNKKWAKGYDSSTTAFDRAILNAHPTLIDSFVTHTRKLYTELGAERFALPGKPESGETVHGYEIVRAIELDNRRGFAIGLDPNAPAQFVTWQFTTENGARDYYWGSYNSEFADAALNYTARTLVHMTDEKTKEVQRTFDFEKGAEQNYNMIDGVPNNEGTPKPDLTDGQTYEEIKELAPETLPENNRTEDTPEPIRDDRPPVPNETEANIAAWLAVTASSRFKWVEDDIFRLNGRGAMYYTGGEDGIYMRIQNDGKLEAGKYEGAVPHIGEAFFTVAAVRQFSDFSEAYKAAMETGGKQFLIDMFSGSERQPLVKAVGHDALEDKPSVIKQIREAQKAPKPPVKPKPEHNKKKTEQEL